jgi:hypothetical protein
MKPGPVLERLEPLRGGRDTEIDMIEREMEGGVVVIQPLEIHEHYSEGHLGGLVVRTTPLGDPTT